MAYCGQSFIVSDVDICLVLQKFVYASFLSEISQIHRKFLYMYMVKKRKGKNILNKIIED